MARSYGLEEILVDIKAVVYDKLNTKIDEINAEKNDGITLSQVRNEAYILQSLDGSEANFNPFIFYGADDISSESRGPNSSKKYSLFVLIVIADDGQDKNISTRMFRYLRAIEEILKENWNNKGGAKIEVKSLVPVPLPSLNSSNPSRATGVQIETNIG